MSSGSTAATSAKIEQADVEIGQRLARNRRRPAVRAAHELVKLSDQEPLYLASVSLLTVGLVTRRRGLARAGMDMLVAVAAADLMKRVIKKTFARTRPRVLLDQGRYDRHPGGDEDKDGQSFPSGHTACGVAAACALGRSFPAMAPVAGAAALGVGATRVADGSHWPLDVAAGGAIGVVAEVVGRGIAGSVRSALAPVSRP